MEEKITTYEDYQNSLKEKKIIRDDLYNLKIKMFMSKKEPEKLKLFEEKNKIVKRKYAKLAFKIKQYEIENNIEDKKEGKKK